MRPIVWGACGSIVVLGLTFLLVGSPQAARLSTAASNTEPSALSELRGTAYRLYAAGSFNHAAELCAEGYKKSVLLRNQRSAMLFLINLGGARFASFQYQAALDAYLRARSIAESRGDSASLGMIWSNLSSLYLAVGDLSSSRFAAEQGLKAAGHAPFGYWPQLLAQAGWVRAQSGQTDYALRYFEQAVDALDGASDLSSRATVLNIVGRELLRTANYGRAEPYLVEAFRLRKLIKDRDLRLSYLALSELRLAQHDVRSAAALIDEACSMPTRDAGPPLWSVYHQRGDARLAEGRLAEAVASFSLALQAAKEWREEAAPSDLSRAGTDVGLHHLYRSFIDSSLRLPHPPLPELFLASEEDRAASLRREVLSAQSWRKNVASAYWEKLAELRASQQQLVANNSEENRASVRQVLFELNELEAQSKLYAPITLGYRTEEKYQPGIALSRLQQKIRPEEALLSFYQGGERTYLWAVTRGHFEFHTLSNSQKLKVLVDQFRNSVRTSTGGRDEAGARLYRELFGQVSPAIRKQPRWLITADDALFEVPFSALVVKLTDKPVYLLEEHSTQRIPSALMLSNFLKPMVHGAFLGIGDGVYNTADSRWERGKMSKAPLQLARLVASSQELRSCAQQWGAPSPILLTGIQASRQSIEASLLASRPAVIHIAAHILYPQNAPDQALIDLGLARSGGAEVLTREDISQLSATGAMVVMSGCSSAATPSVPGSGVTGLVRAWLIAGAAVVIGSRWPTPDDSGELFQSLYQQIYGRRGTGSIRAVSDSMRDAQLDMLHSGTWRADPSYWGAFYVLGKE